MKMTNGKIRKEIKYSNEEWDKVIEFSDKSGKLPAAYIRDQALNIKIKIKDVFNTDYTVPDMRNKFHREMNEVAKTVNISKAVFAKYYDEYKNMKPCIENHISTKEDVDNAASELEKLRLELANMQGEYESAISEKKAVTAHYSTFIHQLETDYAYYCKAGQKELAEYEANLSKPPKKQFSEVVQQMSDWADKALEKVAEKERAEARKNRSDYSR